MTTLRISTVQTQLHWENIPANLHMLDRKLTTLKGQTDLVVLPEMFTTGFSMNPSKLAQPMDGQTVNWLKEKAQYLNAVVTGSFIAEAQGNFYNRLIWMPPSGEYTYYDKRHLFSYAKENLYFTAGKEKLITTIKSWKVCPLICYDLRFPVWSRNVEDYDLLIYVANWPNTRSAAWRTLLSARAIENQCYTVGVNIVGEDGEGLKYRGDSSVIDYGGQVLHQISQVEGITTIEIDKSAMLQFRSKLDFLADKDEFTIQ